ncbi:hypothetical protein [Spongiimicrobium salis]|uniref:hypothetical protein n=1 Tax=Spongiimicrobium salis TaxID=1667022 RepID=UPI00374D2DBB
MHIEDIERKATPFFVGMPDEAGHFWGDKSVERENAIFEVLVDRSNGRKAIFTIISGSHKVIQRILRKEIAHIDVACSFQDRYINCNQIQTVTPGILELQQENRWKIVKKTLLRTDYIKQSDYEVQLFSKIDTKIQAFLNHLQERIQHVKTDSIMQHTTMDEYVLKKTMEPFHEKLQEVETKLDQMIKANAKPKVIETIDNTTENSGNVLKNIRSKICKFLKEPIAE